MSFPFVVVTPGQEAAGQVSQITSQDTYASVNAPLSVIGSGGGGPTVIPANLVVSTLRAATSVSTLTVNALSLLNISSINGAVYVPGGGGSVPADLTVSTLTAAQGISTSVLKVTGGGAEGELGLVMGTNVAFVTESLVLAFNSQGQENVDQGQLAILKSNGLRSVSKPTALGGLGVYAFSTVLGSYQPLGASDIYIFEQGIDNYDTQAFMLEAKNSPVSSLNVQAPNVNISSLLGVSSINGINFARISTVVGQAP
jgi:hypothetical protein